MVEAIAAETILGEDGAFQDGWLNSMPEGTFEKDDTGKLKQGDLADIKNIGAMAKSYLNKDKLLGASIQPLPEKPTDDQIKAHRAKVGCPETIDGYKIEKPELPEGMKYDDELIKAVSQFAHDNHVPKGVFEGLVKLTIESQAADYKKAVEAAVKERDKGIETAENQLKGEWGADYDKNLEIGNRFYDLPGNDAVNKAFTELMAEKGLNSNPVVVKFFHEAYKLVKDDTVPEGEGAAGKGTKSGQLDYSKVVGHSGR